MAAGKLIHQRYGKARVRVLKVFRQDGRHTVKEVDVTVQLEGNFSAAYLHGDNRLVVPTDTMKNTVQVLAQDHLGAHLETFALAVSQHFLARYRQVSQATIHVNERGWQRLDVDGQPHPHSFVRNGGGRPFARVVSTRATTTVEAGVEDLLILKSTGSGFEGFPKDDLTTLPETADRILATTLKAAWLYHQTPVDYGRANADILAAMLKVFAVNYSPSVQSTLYQMAEAALQAVPEISQVTLTMPNQHCLLANLTPFGRENHNEIFVPTDEPHGVIEATVARQ